MVTQIAQYGSFRKRDINVDKAKEVYQKAKEVAKTKPLDDVFNPWASYYGYDDIEEETDNG